MTPDPLDALIEKWHLQANAWNNFEPMDHRAAQVYRLCADELADVSRLRALPEQTTEAIEALSVARDALGAFAKEAGYLPEQGGYSTRMRDSEYKLAEAAQSLDAIVSRLRALVPHQEKVQDDSTRVDVERLFEATGSTANIASGDK